MPQSQYPRPDFQRLPLRWESLNGPWDFLFDDEDVGLSNGWQHHDLPKRIKLCTAARHSGPSPEADNIVERIAAGTQELIENNDFSRNTRNHVHFKKQIQVPFVFQSPASGINDRGVHEVLWYERDITDPRTENEKQQGKRTLVRFGAVDYVATVWVNGRMIGSHRGGHVPFELDATEALDANPSPSHRLTVRVYDSAYDLTQPRGKQYWGAKPESIFYTPSGGIWQSVWIEAVPGTRIADSSHGTALRSEDIRTGKLRGTVAIQGRRAGQACKVEIESSFAGVPVGKTSPQDLARDANSVNFSLDMRLSSQGLSMIPPPVFQDSPFDDDSCWRDGLALWSPEHPLLYDVKIRLLSGSGAIIDEVETYVGMRSLNWTRGDGLWRLNDKPYFQALCLDQGYWPDTFMTAPSSGHLKQDIELAKEMGLNGCRKHQKVEDPLFYYYADKMGYLIWAEMANAYAFSQTYADRFNQEWTEAVKLAINHPSVVTWTPVNESWGYPSLKDNVDQRNHIRALYYITKTLDPTRSVNDNCGWEHVITDISTFHDYSDGPKLAKTCSSLDAILDRKDGRDMFVPDIPDLDVGTKHRAGVPVMCTEFGGVNIAPAKSEEESREWGYTTARDPDDLLKRIERLVRGVVEGGHCCAFVYTQLTDIEQEVNGLYTFDRKEKLDSSKVKAMINAALREFYNRVGEPKRQR